MNETYFISVCTLGENPNLNHCLNTLLDISARSTEDVKVAVVINGECHEKKFDPNIIVVHEPIRGYSSARNAAVVNVPINGNLIFIDDDCVPSDSWLQAMVDSHRRFPRDVIFGPGFSDSESNSGYYRDIFRSKFESMPDATLVKQAGSGNMLIPGYLIEAGKIEFDPIFNLSGSEDTDLCFRLRKQGVGIRYSKNAVVKEVQTPERKNREYLNARRLRDICNYSVVIRRNSGICQILWRLLTLGSRVVFYSITGCFSQNLRFEREIYVKSTQALLNGRVV